MKRQKAISRKLFLKSVAAILTGFFGWIWFQLGKTSALAEIGEEYQPTATIPPGISHYGKYYIYRKGEVIKAYSTTCTHAGCRIALNGDGLLQCGCHGSRFDAPTGKPLRGPAILPLQQLDCNYDAKESVWVVKERDNLRGMVKPI